MNGDPKNLEFVYKKLCIYSYMFKFQSPSKYSPFDAIYPLRQFFHCSKHFGACWFWCLIVLLPFFISPLSYWHNFSLWRLFSSRKTKKKSLGPRSGEWEGWGVGVMLFLVKTCWTLCAVWADVLLNHPSWNGQMRWKGLQKKFTEVEHSLSQQHQLVHWYRWFLEHSPRGGSLYYKGPAPKKINFILGESPCNLIPKLEKWYDLLIP